jgi:hypothetical protein
MAVAPPWRAQGARLRQGSMDVQVREGEEGVGLWGSSGRGRGGCGLDTRRGREGFRVRVGRASERLKGTRLTCGTRGSAGEGARAWGGRWCQQVGPSMQREEE